MATIPAVKPEPQAAPESIEVRFRRLAATWKNAVAFLSSSRQRESHPAYVEIIDLGAAVVPFLLRDLEENETHWLTALHQITGADPVPEADAGNIARMKEAWLQWARTNGYRW
jgi:hypothetical protein